MQFFFNRLFFLLLKTSQLIFHMSFSLSLSWAGFYLTPHWFIKVLHCVGIMNSFNFSQSCHGFVPTVRHLFRARNKTHQTLVIFSQSIWCLWSFYLILDAWDHFLLLFWLDVTVSECFIDLIESSLVLWVFTIIKSILLPTMILFSSVFSMQHIRKYKKKNSKFTWILISYKNLKQIMRWKIN